MKILVTGGAGFIGSHLVERLLERGDEVVCLDNFNDFYDPAIKRKNISSTLKNPSYKLIEGDTRDRNLLQALAEQHKFDLVVHLAARAGVRASIGAPHLYEDVNCGGTINLLEMARRVGINYFVFGSSSSVYGVGDKVPFSENDVVEHPISPYAATKRACELFCHTYHHLYRINVTCLRFFTAYGPRQRPEMAIHKFTRKIMQGEPIEIYGDGKSSRDYTYIDDVIDGVLKAIDKRLAFEIINLGESRTVQLSQLIGILEEATGQKAAIKRLPPQPGDVPRTYADISKAKAVLDYHPKTQIEEGVKKFVAWYRNNTAL